MDPEDLVDCLTVPTREKNLYRDITAAGLFAINSQAAKTAKIKPHGNFPLYIVYLTGFKVSHVLEISCMHTSALVVTLCNTCCSAERCNTVIGVTVTFLLTVVLYTALLLMGCAVWRRVQIGKTK